MNPLQNLYDIIDTLKDGKTGKVSLVYDKVGKQICVLKERSLHTAEIYRRLKEIKNICIPEIYRIIEFNGTLFVVEEFIEGQTLAEILTYKNNLNEKIAAQILKQLCEGLKTLHEEKIIHRDLKPSNIMLTKNNSVKLIDFSISRIAKENSESDTDFLGTRGYAPPEQFGFGQTDARSDIYSLGVTFKKILGENYGGYLKKILSKCTELDPVNRYQSTEEIFFDIDKKFWQYRLKNFLLKFFAFGAVIFTVLFFPTNIFENEIPQENKNLEKNFSKPEDKKISDKKIPEPQQKDFQFPEIKIPETSIEPSPKNFELPKVEVEENFPSDPRLKQICTLYLNGKIFNTEIPAEIWQNWRHDGETLYFPENWNLTLKIENKNSAPLSVNLEIKLNGNKKFFSANIPANQFKNFTVSLGNYSLSSDLINLEIRLNTAEEIIFSWHDGSFGNYRNFRFYLECAHNIDR